MEGLNGLVRYSLAPASSPFSRSLIFVPPKNLRRPFYRDRKLLTGLCRSAVESTHAFYRTGLGQEDLRVGMVVVPQRFGDRANPHIHLHALSTDGAFDSTGVFHPMPLICRGTSRCFSGCSPNGCST